MKLRSIKRGIGDGFKSILRNGRMTFASIATITVCLIVLALTFIVYWNVRSFTTQFDDNLCVVVFMREGISEQEIMTLKNNIDRMPEVARSEYVSAEAAWEEFQKDLEDGGSMDPELLEYVEDNPLKNSANIRVFLKNANRQESLVSLLKNEPLVRKLNYSSETSKVLSNLSNAVAVVGIAMMALLIFVSTVLISNTVRMSVYIRKDEISIMKYLGASNSFVKLPFFAEGVIIGLLGAILPCVLVWFGYDYLLSLISEKFSAITDLVTFVPKMEIVTILFPLFGILAVVVGTVGSLLSMKKYLKA